MTPRRLEVPRIPVNFADVQDFEALPEDDYTAIIEKATMVLPTEDGKHPYINLQFDVTEEGEFKGRKVFTILSFSPKALFKMKQSFENLSIIEPDDEIDVDYDEESMRILEPELEGIPCNLTLGIRTYEGREQNDVLAITAVDTEPQKKAAPGTKKSTTTKKAAAKPAAAKKPAGRKFK